MFAQLGHAQTVPTSSFVLPVGDELEEEDLLNAEGEQWHWIAAVVSGFLWAIGSMIYDAFFDGEPGFQHTRAIVGGALGVYSFFFVLGSWASTLWTIINWFR